MSTKSRRLFWLGGMALLAVLAGFMLLKIQRRPRFPREGVPQELEQQGRAALEAVSRDASLAWASLPPEYPAITTREIDPSVGDHDPDVFEIVRARSDVDPGPHAVASFDGEKVVLKTAVPDLGTDELVLVYNDALDRRRGWVLGRVSRVEDRIVELATDAIPAAYHKLNPPFPWKGKLTRVSVVRYFMGDDPLYQPGFPEKPLRALVRLEDFERAYRIAYLEDFQVVYLMGLESPKEADNPPSISVPVVLEDVPQLRITVTHSVRHYSLHDGTTIFSKSPSTNIRKTFSTRVLLRNLVAAVQERLLKDAGVSVAPDPPPTAAPLPR